ncbi:MAG TPA: penicillin-binding transpeptidase domain-containing protein [Acidimicrobiales bacterium]
MVAVVLAVVVATGLLVGLLRWTGADTPATGPPSAATVLEPAQAWFHAWETDDRAAMASMAGVTGPAKDKMLAALAAYRDGLGGLERTGGKLQVTAGTPRIEQDRADVPYVASVTLAGLGTWDYPGTVTVVRAGGKDGDWQTVWNPSDLYPGLTDTRHLDLAVTWPARAPLVLADGTPAAGKVSATILGRVGPATAAQASSLGPPYRAGQAIGVSGLQASQERLLAGTPAVDVRLLEGTVVVGVPYHQDGTMPLPATVTIDPHLQAVAQQALDGAPPGKLAAMVVIRPSTGDILVSASRPAGGYDRAFLGLYPPGSTFKTITTIALLTKGMGLDETISCPAQVAIGGRTFVNAEGHVLGNIPFRRAFAESCNTAFVQLAQRLTPQELRATADALGFNRDPALGVPAATSSVPVPEGPVDLAASSIGQGRILVTPLQMATVAASVATGGYRPPRLVANGPPVPVTPFAPGVAAATTELMRLVVTDGTGTAARLPGTPVAGKTGTAEFGTANPPQTHAWFIAFRGDLAVAVLVDDGGFGGDVAAPIAANFFRAVGG